jgi:hypothetical protein
METGCSSHIQRIPGRVSKDVSNFQSAGSQISKFYILQVNLEASVQSSVGQGRGTHWEALQQTKLDVMPRLIPGLPHNPY